MWKKRFGWGAANEVNVKGSTNVLEAVRGLRKKPRVLLVGSGEEYGRVLPGETPVRETSPARSGNIYAATKACQKRFSMDSRSRPK